LPTGDDWRRNGAEANQAWTTEKAADLPHLWFVGRGSYHPRHDYSNNAKIYRRGQGGSRRSRGMGRHDAVVLQKMSMRLERAMEEIQETGKLSAGALNYWAKAIKIAREVLKRDG
jgi:hypothetical protein